MTSKGEQSSVWNLGVCYYPEHWSKNQWKTDIATMLKLGITKVRIGEFAWKFIEPSEGELSFNWLDEVIEICASSKVEVILGTPTATPPRWMLSKHPDMLALDENNLARKFGSRRHYCFSHEGYREECKRIVGLLAKRYALNKNITAWQIDNEYGCHDTTYSYSTSAELAFQNWLKNKYASVEVLNDAWGNSFWSMGYDDFFEISLPNNTVTEANPAHRLDFVRFSSHQVKSFNRLQCLEIKKINPDATVVHNFMGQFTQFDHYDVGMDLEIAAWDSYPLGFLQIRNNSDVFKQDYSETGDPDFQSFHHELYRGVCNGRWWVMEQQPGPVNWAPINTAPRKGAVRLWAWEAFAHGAEVVSFFRFRQCPFAQEQMHTGLLLPDSQMDFAGKECEILKDEIADLQKYLAPFSELENSNVDVALVFDYPSEWTWQIQPQTENFSYFELVFLFYRELRKLGLQIGIVSQEKLAQKITENPTAYKSILLPGTARLSLKLEKALNHFKNKIIIGPRAFSKDENFSIPRSLPPAYNHNKLPLQVVRVEALATGKQLKVGNIGSIENWRERVRLLDQTIEVVHKDEEGEAVFLKKENVHYLTCWPTAELIKNIFQSTIAKGVPLPKGVRLTRYNNLIFLFNYGNKPYVTKEILAKLAEKVSPINNFSVEKLEPAGVAVYKTYENT